MILQYSQCLPVSKKSTSIPKLLHLYFQLIFVRTLDLAGEANLLTFGHWFDSQLKPNLCHLRILMKFRFCSSQIPCVILIHVSQFEMSCFLVSPTFLLSSSGIWLGPSPIGPSARCLGVLFSDNHIPLDRSPNLSARDLNFIGTSYHTHMQPTSTDPLLGSWQFSIPSWAGQDTVTCMASIWRPLFVALCKRTKLWNSERPCLIH